MRGDRELCCATGRRHLRRRDVQGKPPVLETGENVSSRDNTHVGSKVQYRQNLKVEAWRNLRARENAEILYTGRRDNIAAFWPAENERESRIYERRRKVGLKQLQPTFRHLCPPQEYSYLIEGKTMNNELA